MVHNIAHFGISGLSCVNQDLSRACYAAGVDCVVCELLESGPLPKGFRSSRVKGVLSGLKNRLIEILLAEGFESSILVEARLTLFELTGPLRDCFDSSKARLVDRRGNIYEDWVELGGRRKFASEVHYEDVARRQADAIAFLLGKEASAPVLYAAGLTESRFWPFNRS